MIYIESTYLYKFVSCLYMLPYIILSAYNKIREKLILYDQCFYQENLYKINICIVYKCSYQIGMHDT